MDLILGSQSPRRRELLERMGLRFRVLTAEIDETKYETEDPEASVRRICEAKARAVAQRLMRENSQFSVLSSQLVLASDTIVVLDGKILGKPHDAAEARAMLRALSGREHAVYTAFTLLPVGESQASGIRHQASGDGGCEAAGDDAATKAFPLRGRWHPASPASRMTDEVASDEASDTSHQAPGDGGCEAAGNCPPLPVTHCEKTFVKFRVLTEDEIDAYVATGEPMDKAGAYGIQGRGMMLAESIRGDYYTVVGLPVCRLARALKQYGIDPLR